MSAATGMTREEIRQRVEALGEWFRNNGETFGETLAWVMLERGEDVENFRAAIYNRDMGIV